MKRKINKKKSYQCPDCNGWFRLKLSLLNHDCTSKIRKKRER